MKRPLFIIAAITLLGIASQAQTPLKVHSDGTVSLQNNGFESVEMGQLPSGV